MAVQRYKERDAIVISWDPGDYTGKVRIVTHSSNDTSETVQETNSGYAALSFPVGQAGGFKAEVLSEPDGDLLDEGTVEA